MNDLLYETRGLEKSYRDGRRKKPVLSGLDISIARGEFVVITGPSGVGKTTLLNLLGFLDTPTAGKVFFKGRDVSRLGEPERSLLRRRDVGFVFQSSFLLEELNVLENVMFPLLLQGASRRRAREIAEPFLVELGIEDCRTRDVNAISTGQRQRAAVARALCYRPDVLLGDEITGNLDTGNTRHLMNCLLSLRDKYNTTLVAASHDPEVADRADRSISLRAGSQTKGGC